MNKLSYSKKLLFLGSIIISIIIFLSVALHLQLNKVIVNSTIQLEGVEKIVALNNLIQLAQQYRGLSVANLGDSTNFTFSDLHLNKEQEIDSTFYSLINSLDSETLILAVDDLSNLWEKIKKDHQLFTVIDTEVEFNAHTSFIRQLLLLTTVIADHYLLITNGDISSYYMIEILLKDIPGTTESMGRIRATVLTVLANKQLSERKKRELIILEAQLEHSIRALKHNLSKVSLYSPHLANQTDSVYLRLVKERETVINRLNNDIYSKQFDTVSYDFWLEITANIDALYRLIHNPIVPDLKNHLKQRIDEAVLTLNTAVAIAVSLLLLTCYFMFALYKALMGNINHISQIINDYSKGDLETRIHLNTQDEMRSISISINQMADKLSKSRRQLLFQKSILDHHAIVSICDEKGNIKYANDNMTQISQYSQSELLGHNHHLLKSDFHPDSFYKELWQTITNGKVWHGEIRNLNKSGNAYWLSSTIAPYINDQGEIEEYIAIQTDISHIKDLEIKQSQVNNLLLTEQLATEQEKQRFQVLFDKSGYGIAIIQDHNFTDFNEEAIKMLAYNSKDEIPNHPSKISPEYQPDGQSSSIKSDRMIAKCLQKGRINFEWVLRRKDGTTFWCDVLLTRLDYQDEQIILSAWRNISAQKQLAADNERITNEAIKANLAKSEFLSSMSHELRTPLNAILGFAQLLESDTVSPLSEVQQESIKYILTSGKHLLNLINEVLELSAIEAGKVELSIEPLKINDVIDSSLSLLAPLADQANIQINVLSDLVLFVSADYTKLKQIIINLVTNGIKYNTKGGLVTINWRKANNNRIRITVTDTGIGISKTQKHKLFNAFNRLGQETSNIEGTGIGLVVTKSLVEKMNGTIGFDSDENKGSSFWFELPFATKVTNKLENVLDVKNTIVVKSITSNDNKKVLYIEDNPANRRLMQSFFDRQKNFTLFMVQSGELGWTLAMEQSFDLILMDIHLPGINGKELTKKLRATSKYRHKPIIAISAAVMKHDVKSAEGLFDEYITKPIRFPHLLKVLKTLLE